MAVTTTPIRGDAEPLWLYHSLTLAPVLVPRNFPHKDLRGGLPYSIRRVFSIE
jgi:hypothetical protein